MKGMISQKVNVNAQMQRAATKIADSIVKKLAKEPRVYWSYLASMTGNDERLLDMSMKELKARNFETGSPKKPYVERQKPVDVFFNF